MTFRTNAEIDGQQKESPDAGLLEVDACFSEKPNERLEQGAIIEGRRDGAGPTGPGRQQTRENGHFLGEDSLHGGSVKNRRARDFHFHETGEDLVEEVLAIECDKEQLHGNSRPARGYSRTSSGIGSPGP